ncbi:MAG: STAS domain-containing protein [Candidatus Delongbacteria bacterium]|nr:STAS domain-containing protein [Candidatus Delongbacteria bacterium]
MVDCNVINGELVCRFPARLDTQACSAMEAGLKEKLDATAEPAVFDLAGVTFISSMFLRICLTHYKQRGKAGFALRNISPDVKKVFMVAGFGEMLA